MTLTSVIIFFLMLTALLGCVIYLMFARLQQLEDVITRPKKNKPLEHSDQPTTVNTIKKTKTIQEKKTENPK